MDKRNAFFLGTAAGVVLGGLTWLTVQRATAPQGVEPLPLGEHFPTVRGRTLSGQPVVIPDDLIGSIGVLVAAQNYAARQQVEAWMFHLEQQYSADTRLRWLALPMISGVGPVSRMMIDTAMARETPANAREHIVTIYGDLRGLFQQLQMHSPQAYIFLLGRTGRLLWRAEGAPSPEMIEALADALGSQGIITGGNV